MKHLMAIAFTFVATSAAAQHPCDENPPTEQTISSGVYRVQLCARASEGPEAVMAVVNGVPIDRVPITAISDVSASGLMLYESIPFLQVTRGTHVFTLAVYTRNASGALEMSPMAGPFSIRGR